MNSMKSYVSYPFLPLALAAAVCLLGSATASAGPIESRSTTVSFRDLDLSNPYGVTTLYQRIKAAAEKVCGYQGTDFIERSIWRGCVRGAVDDAVAKVNNPLLTALHTGRTPTVTAMIDK